MHTALPTNPHASLLPGLPKSSPIPTKADTAHHCVALTPNFPATNSETPGCSPDMHTLHRSHPSRRCPSKVSDNKPSTSLHL